MVRNFLAGFGLTVITWLAYNMIKKYYWEAAVESADRRI